MPKLIPALLVACGIAWLTVPSESLAGQRGRRPTAFEARANAYAKPRYSRNYGPSAYAGHIRPSVAEERSYASLYDHRPARAWDLPLYWPGGYRYGPYHPWIYRGPFLYPYRYYPYSFGYSYYGGIGRSYPSYAGAYYW